MLLSIFLKYIASFGVGIQESVFRYSIGTYIKSLAQGQDIIMLEPAGWIPYPTNLVVIDEVGLISKDFFNFLANKKPNESIAKYWKIKKPEFLIQRSHIFDLKDSLGNKITKEEYLWFNENYKLIKKFDYEDYIKSEKSNLKRNIMKISRSTNYYVFRKKGLYK